MIEPLTYLYVLYIVTEEDKDLSGIQYESLSKQFQTMRLVLIVMMI